MPYKIFTICLCSLIKHKCHFCCFQIFTITKNATMNFFVYVSCVHTFLCNIFSNIIITISIVFLNKVMGNIMEDAKYNVKRRLLNLILSLGLYQTANCYFKENLTIYDRLKLPNNHTNITSLLCLYIFSKLLLSLFKPSSFLKSYTPGHTPGCSLSLLYIQSYPYT